MSDTYGRIAFKWLASDNITARLEATTTRDRDETVPEVPLVINPNYPGSDLAAFNSKVAVPLTGIPINQSFINRNPYSNYATFNNPLSGLQFQNNNPQTIWDITGKLDWQLPGHMTFTSISGYHNQNGSIVEYKDGPIPINMVQNNIRYESYTEEDRLSGTSFGDKFDWTAGVYYFHGQGTDQSDVHLVVSQVGAVPTRHQRSSLQPDHGPRRIRLPARRVSRYGRTELRIRAPATATTSSTTLTRA